jgi:hypothetical protein
MRPSHPPTAVDQDELCAALGENAVELCELAPSNQLIISCLDYAAILHSEYGVLNQTGKAAGSVILWCGGEVA